MGYLVKTPMRGGRERVCGVCVALSIRIDNRDELKMRKAPDAGVPDLYGGRAAAPAFAFGQTRKTPSVICNRRREWRDDNCKGVAAAWSGGA